MTTSKDAQAVFLYLLTILGVSLLVAVIFAAALRESDSRSCLDDGGVPMKTNRGSECVRGGK